MFSLKFTCAMKIIKIMCEKKKDCKDCHGKEGDIAPAPDQDSTKPKYSLKVRKSIEIRDTIQVIKDAIDVFKGIGKLKGYLYRIEVDDKVQLVVSRRYSVLPPMQEPLKKNLDCMVDIDIIKKQKEAIPWVSNVLCTPKPSEDIRICHNPKPLNKAVKRPHHYAPAMEDILQKLQGSKYFSTLDQSSGH